MKPFNEWLQELGKPAEPELPDGVVEVRPGYFEAECRGCECWTPIDYDLSDFDPSYHYCGGSPRCCP